MASRHSALLLRGGYCRNAASALGLVVLALSIDPFKGGEL
jgi:hypothetical protein